MPAIVVSALLCAVLGGGAQGYRIQYRCPAGARLMRDVQETGEFTVIADLPGSERFEGKVEGRGRVEYEIGEFRNDHLPVRIRGSWETMLEINDSPMDAQVEEVGPGTLQVTEFGEITGVELPAFEVSEKSVTQLKWWNYITNQLNLVDGLPAGSVRVNESWENVSKIRSPVGDELTLTTRSAVMGNAWNEGNCVWIQSEGRLPLKLRFETEKQRYHVNGTVDMTSVICFNLDKGYPTEKKTSRVASLSFHSKGDADSGGRDFSMRLVFMSRSRSKARLVSNEGSGAAGKRPESAPAPVSTKP